MPYNSFLANVRRGRVGEEFVNTYLSELTDAIILNHEVHAGDYIEGADATAHRIQLGDQIDDFIPDYVDDPSVREGTAYDVAEWVSGGVEVKTTWGFLFRTYDQENPAGTLPFSLWSSFSRENAGWLLKLMHPERFSDSGEMPGAVQPHTLIFILAEYENAFASIAFCDIPALIDRLRSLAHDENVDLDDGIPFGTEAQDWLPANMIIAGNVWFVPLSRIEDLAKVTMIGEKPRIRPDIASKSRTCSARTQNLRYDHLLVLSAGRHIIIDERFRDVFTPSKQGQIYADIIYNLSVIESLDSGTYPTLSYYRKQRVFDHLRGIMLNMLAHEVPVWPEMNPRYFALGKIYLETWCKANGIAGSTMSWQGSLVFLKDCGLIKCFCPIGDTHSPAIDRILEILPPKHGKSITLRSVPRFTDEVLAHAEHVARMYRQQRITLAKLTKTDVIRCRGEEIAKQLYLDGRTISEVELYVYDLYMRVLLQNINRNGYALKNDIHRAVYMIIQRDQRFQRIDRDHLLSQEERDELTRQEPFLRAFIKMKNRCPQLSLEAGYSYHPVRKRDRVAFNLPENFHQWIIS